LPNLGIVAANPGRIRISRTRETMLDGNDNVRLVMLQRSRTSAPATQLGRDLTVEPGGAVALFNCDLNAITFPEPSKLLALNLTRKMLRPLLRDFDMVLGRVIPKQVAPLRLLASYIEAVLNEPAPPTAEFSQLISAHIYDLASLTMGATRDAAELAPGPNNPMTPSSCIGL